MYEIAMSTDPNSLHSLSEALGHARVQFESENYRQAENTVSDVLKTWNDCSQAWFLLSLIKAARGLTGKQIECLERAIALDPENGEYLAFMAQALLDQGRLGEAGEQALAAWRKSEKHAGALRLLGGIFHSVGRYDFSVLAYQKSIERENNDAASFYGLGVSLALCGRIVEAREAYRQAIERDPGHVKAWPALSKIRQAREEDNHVGRLAELARKTRNPWLAINVYHGWAKELDDLGNYREAFAVLEEGKNRLRTLCPHDPFLGARRVTELCDFYSSLAVEPNNSGGYHDDAPIFVVGMPRTGTTVVERILTNHPDVTTIGERPQFSLLLKTLCEHSAAGIVGGEALGRAWASLELRELGERYVHSVKYLSGDAERFVDKLPLNILYAGVIMLALPNARVVCLVRDPCDTVIGNYRQVFEYATGVYAWSLDLEAAARFVVAFSKLVDVLKRQFPKRFHTVDYDSLVTAPRELAPEMFGFCGLEWSESYLSIHENPLPIGSASTSQVQEPIHERFTRRSRNYAFCLDGVKSIFDENGVRFRTDQDDRLQ
jgi:tetratricopeptide (TPR) repeat protein